jgi:hypothetical protein
MKEIKGETYEHGWQRYKLVCKSFISRYRFESIIKVWCWKMNGGIEHKN